MEWLLLIACSFLLLVVELLNTAIETVVDRISLELHPLSKRAKDLGSAAGGGDNDHHYLGDGAVGRITARRASALNRLLRLNKRLLSLLYAFGAMVRIDCRYAREF
ncbi:Diacylglycerol kinase [Serratia marcescens]|uniref:diacylglycerol kinase n=1 Tax=Serratia TaxID=613 RepID=UPI00074508C5|nr:diacylglycerol kinase [Serratia marcescens]CUZ94662.1 Diacylglycerol kinase [Serratia marcescens]